MHLQSTKNLNGIIEQPLQSYNRSNEYNSNGKAPRKQIRKPNTPDCLLQILNLEIRSNFFETLGYITAYKHIPA